MLLCRHLEILPGDAARREISADRRSLMVPRGGLLGINCIQSDIYLSAGSPFACWQAPSSQTKDRPTLRPLLGEGRWAGNLLSPRQCHRGGRTLLLRALLYCFNVTICLLQRCAKLKCMQPGVAASYCLCSPTVPGSIKIYPAFTQWTSTSKEQSCCRSVVQILLATLLS